MENAMQNKWFKIFSDYADKKTVKAREADIPGFTTPKDGDRSHLFQGELAKLDHHWVVSKFDGPFHYRRADREGIRVNLVFVQTKPEKGKIFGDTGADNPGDIGGGETDKHLVYEGLSRVHADAVMAGRKTVRGLKGIFSVWHPELVSLRAALTGSDRRHPAQIVVTRNEGEKSEDRIIMDEELMFNIPAIQVFVVTTEKGAPDMRAQSVHRQNVEVISTGRKLDLREGLAVLADAFGIRAISVVGGRQLATELIDNDLVDDLYLTTSSLTTSALGSRVSAGTPFYASKRDFPRELVVRKRGRGKEEGVVFEHFRIAI